MTTSTVHPHHPAPHHATAHHGTTTTLRKADTNLLLLSLLAILLPPLAVFIKRGCGVEVLVSIVLLFCFWVPGLIYALLVIFDKV